MEKNTNCIVSKDTDVYVQLIYTFTLKYIMSPWVMKFGHSKYENFAKVVEYLGSKIVLKLPQLHAVTGCDTISSMFPLAKVLRNA